MHLLPRMNVMIDLIYMGSVDQPGRVNSEDIENEKKMPIFGLDLTTMRFVFRASTYRASRA